MPLTALHSKPTEQRVSDLLSRMNLEEKVGQLTLANGFGGWIPDDVRASLSAGRIGAILNEVDPDTVNELQRVAVEESRLGVPLLIGRDVIHGFKTVFPIPLGQAASWNPERIREGARIAALEAASTGVNWTFAPMMDICRDPRWGRIAETLGEDPYLTSVLAAAMVEGFQGEDLSAPGSIAACAKHFAGYGASEAGRDYNTTNIPENELRNVHLPPFEAALEAGVASFMTSFSDLDGIPASANDFLLRQILRNEWEFDGFVVSDWDSIPQLAVHGLTSGDRDSALQAAMAGVDMEMASSTYREHLTSLVEKGQVDEEQLDAMVANVLRAKFRLGLFEDHFTDTASFPGIGIPGHLEAARAAAVESCVLLRNEHRRLPLAPEKLNSLAVIGPLADEPAEQLGTWIFDGDPGLSVTPLQAIREVAEGSFEVRVARGCATTRSRSTDGFADAIEAARSSDCAVMFVGEEAILSGEAHCRATVDLPGNQADLIREVAQTDTPIVLVILAGRPLALQDVVEHVDAILYAWHPGTMAGPAIADLLFGNASPSGKLPVTFPKVTGQIPIYYAHKNTGKPPTPESVIDLEHLDAGAEQLSIGHTSFHLDVGYTPLYAFGHGLAYTTFAYGHVECSDHSMALDGSITLSVEVTNTGDRVGEEVVQLYVRDPVASLTRPVRELKSFQRVRLEPEQRTRVEFRLDAAALAFHGRDGRKVTEPGRFRAWIGGSSETNESIDFEVINT